MEKQTGEMPKGGRPTLFIVFGLLPLFCSSHTLNQWNKHSGFTLCFLHRDALLFSTPLSDSLGVWETGNIRCHIDFTLRLTVDWIDVNWTHSRSIVSSHNNRNPENKLRHCDRKPWEQKWIQFWNRQGLDYTFAFYLFVFGWVAPGGIDFVTPFNALMKLRVVLAIRYFMF